MTKSSLASPRSAGLAGLACITAGLSLAVVGGCSAASNNPLIGTWKFVSTTEQSGPKACSTTFVFAAKQATITNPPDSIVHGTRTMAVSYVTASPSLVAVMTNAAGHVNYTFTDHNHMYLEDAWGRCNYERAK